MDLWKKVILIGEVEGGHFCFLEVDFHRVIISENKKISKLVLEHRQVRVQGKYRNLM